MHKLRQLTLKNLLISFIMASVIAGFVWQSFRLLQQEQMTAAVNATKYAALTKLFSIASALESELNETIKYSDFLSLIVSHNPDITQEELDGYAQLVLEQNDSIVGIQVAPDGIVQMVYPYEQHKMAIGHDLLKDPHRKQYALQAIETGKAVLQGPVQAIQGGYFLFNRKAIFTPTEIGQKFWGLSVVAVDFDRLMDVYQKTFHDEQYLFSLSVRDDNDKPVLLWGDAQTSSSNTIQQSIVLPHATWDLKIFPKTSWDSANTTLIRTAVQFHLGVTALVFLLAFVSTLSYLRNWQQSLIDPLTGSLNKNSIFRHVSTLLKRRKPFTLLVMDLNSFKQVNDQYGHYIGDLVLIEITQRIQNTLSKEDRLSRFGGDEYIATITTNQDDIETLAQQIRINVMSPMVVEGHTFQINLAIGWAQSKADNSSTYSSLYQEADQRMYMNKAQLKTMHSSGNDMSLPATS